MTPESDKPLVSIALPAYNAARTLRLAIRSILSQTQGDFELLVLDDGSQDATRQIVERFADARIRYVHDGRNLGLPRRLNQAVEMARGRYFARMDADDVAFPRRLEMQTAWLETHPEVDLLGTQAITIDDALNPTGLFPYRETHAEIAAKPWTQFYLCHPTWMGRLSWFRANPYAIPEFWFAEDQELLLRTHASSRFHCLDEVLLAYRIGDPNFRRIGAARRQLLRAMWQYHTKQGSTQRALAAVGHHASRKLFDFARQVPVLRNWVAARQERDRGRMLSDTMTARWIAVRDRLLEDG
jgi:glycosyltransferase involved in cell wall biosynthesis